ncbi:MAG: sulfite exporter TauE/SafE family protein [Ruminococcaceae bacterium]|nr:sulfite exporter TauE/SafE family protein [Oscillospiraceae bacterium]
MLTAIVIFFLSVLSGMGVGSAGLLVTWLTVACHSPQLVAQGVNLIYFIFSAGAALVLHVFRTPLLWKCILFLLPAGILGSLLGVRLALWLPEELLRRLFGWALILIGGSGLFRQR